MDIDPNEGSKPAKGLSFTSNPPTALRIVPSFLTFESCEAPTATAIPSSNPICQTRDTLMEPPLYDDPATLSKANPWHSFLLTVAADHHLVAVFQKLPFLAIRK